MATIINLPPLNALRAFDAAGRHLNFRVAADKIGVTQGAIAQHARALEARLGLRLFERQHRSLAFTDAGRRYHGQVAQAFDLLADATAQLAPEPLKVTISVTPTFASKWLIPNLGDFTAQHPEIDLRILATESLSSFHLDGIDLVVRQGRPPFGASLEAERLFEQDIIAVCAPEITGSKDGLHNLVLLHDTHNLWVAFLKEIGVEEIPLARGVRFNQTAHSIEAALSGQGVALASRFLVANDLATGRLVQEVPGHLRGETDFYLLAPRKPKRSSAEQAVWQWLIKRAHGSDQVI